MFTCVFAQEKYLLVVDVQRQFYEDTPLEADALKMITNINQIIEKTRTQNIIYIQASGKVLTISLKGVKVIPMIPDPEPDSLLNVVNTNIFSKTEADAFSLDTLNNFLNQNNIQEIMVTGLLAEKCIYKTAIGGLARGYTIYVVPEAILSKSEKTKNKALKKMKKKGIKVLPVKDIISPP